MADNDFVQAFTSFMESQGAILTEISARVRALERYLKEHDSSFGDEYARNLDFARKEVTNPSFLLMLSKDEKVN